MTSLIGSDRRSKSSSVFEILGTLDELNAVLGLVANAKNPNKQTKKIKESINMVQNDLFCIGALLAEKYAPVELKEISQHIEEFEKIMDGIDKSLSPLNNFILPGGTEESSYLHLARSVCRKLERIFVKASKKNKKNLIKNEILFKYLNRLSDFLFVLARYSNHLNKVPDIIWKRQK